MSKSYNEVRYYKVASSLHGPESLIYHRNPLEFTKNTLLHEQINILNNKHNK